MQILMAGVIVLGALSHWLAWRFKLPSILFLLLIGIVAGPVTGVLDPDLVLGDALFPLVSLSVAVILFEGSMTLRWSDLRGIGPAVWGLSTLGAAITFVLVAFAAHGLLSLSWPVSALLGAILSVTGPTVVVPMLRAIRPVSSVANTLRWEGIVVDPLGAMLAVLVAEFVRTQSIDSIWLAIAKLVASGLACGLVAAFGLAFVLSRHLVPWFMRNVVALAFVLASFAIANRFAHEAGLLAVTVMGMALANMRQVNVDDIFDFKESLTLLLVAVLFIVLAARIDFAEFRQLDWGLLFFLVAVIFVIRPVAVFASTFFSRLTLREKLLISWISPRGIVAASVASLFALALQERGVAGAEQVVPVIFSVIIATVVLQSATAGRIARWLELASPEPRDVIIVGAGEPNRAFAGKLRSAGYGVLLADTDWTEVRRARMAGFDAYFGRIVSDHAEGHIDYGSIGYLFGMSPQRDQNILAALHFRPDLGADSVFAMQTDEERGKHMKELAGSLRVPQLFGPDFTYGDWARLVAEGAEFRLTRMTESFGFREYRDSLPGEFIPLLGIDGRGRLRPFVAEGRPVLRPGWQLLSLIPHATLDAEGSQRRAASPPAGAAAPRKSAAESLRGHSAHEGRPGAGDGDTREGASGDGPAAA
ncbi:MAG: sodium:proton antiporter [Burkholderiaceae bacterium]|nr:sodium:proton antiporter [Burkholderiaceae bacterium]